MQALGADADRRIWAERSIVHDPADLIQCIQIQLSQMRNRCGDKHHVGAAPAGQLLNSQNWVTGGRIHDLISAHPCRQRSTRRIHFHQDRPGPPLLGKDIMELTHNASAHDHDILAKLKVRLLQAPQAAGHRFRESRLPEVAVRVRQREDTADRQRNILGHAAGTGHSVVEALFRRAHALVVKAPIAEFAMAAAIQRLYHNRIALPEGGGCPLRDPCNHSGGFMPGQKRHFHAISILKDPLFPCADQAVLQADQNFARSRLRNGKLLHLNGLLARHDKGFHFRRNHTAPPYR